MHIRKATINDARTVSDCVSKAYEHYILRIGKPPGPMLDNYSDIIEKHIVYVAELNGEIIGLVVLMVDHDPILLDNLAVDPTKQGRGIGRKLLVFAEQVARDRNHYVIQLYTNEFMHENIEFYSRQGYRITHHCDEKGYKRIYMRKDL